MAENSTKVTFLNLIEGDLVSGCDTNCDCYDCDTDSDHAGAFVPKE